MRFNSVKGGDFTSSAKAVTRNFDAFLDTSVKTATDFTKISLAAQKGRSVERQATKKAAGGVDLANIRADSKEKIYDIAYKSDKKVADIKRPAQRMAGIVGGLGALSGYAIMAKNANEEREADERMDALYSQRTKEMTAAIEASKPEPFVPGSYEGTPYTPLPTPPTQGTPSTPSTPGTPSTPTGSQSIEDYPRQSFTQPQLKQLLMDQGMPDADAIIGAAVGMGESHGESWRLNPNTDHEYSLGLWQHNRDTGEDRRDFYGIKNWSELADPVTNARATYRLWKRRGGWDDWGAYTNGSYKKFL